MSTDAAELPDFPFESGPLGQPPPEYAEWRTAEPLGRARMPSGDEVVLITRYDDVRVVLADPRFNRPGGGERADDAPKDIVGSDDWLLNLHPDDHARLRQVVNPLFTPGKLEGWRTRTCEIAAALLEQMTDVGPPADAIAGYAQPLPARVISEVLGLPQLDRASSPAWSMPRGPQRIDTYVQEIIAERRRAPAPGVLSTLIQACDEEARLDESELHAMMKALLRTGHGTIQTTLGRSVFRLLSHPEQYARLAATNEVVDRAVEESLRMEPPGDGSVIRVAAEDVALPSGAVRQGSTVVPLIASANRDERYFRRADTFDMTRSPNPHIAFGYGPHHCLGAHLSRLVLGVGLAELARRVPTLALAVKPDETEWTRGLSRGLRQLLVRW